MVRSPTGRDTARSAVGADPEAYAVIGQLLDETLGPGVFVPEPRDGGVGEQLLPSFHLLDVREKRRIQQCPQLGVFEIARVFREIPRALRDGEGGCECDPLGLEAGEQLAADLPGVANGVQELPDADVDKLFQVGEVEDVSDDRDMMPGCRLDNDPPHFRSDLRQRAVLGIDPHLDEVDFPSREFRNTCAGFVLRLRTPDERHLHRVSAGMGETEARGVQSRRGDLARPRVGDNSKMLFLIRSDAA